MQHLLNFSLFVVLYICVNILYLVEFKIICSPIFHKSIIVLFFMIQGFLLFNCTFYSIFTYSNIVYAMSEIVIILTLRHRAGASCVCDCFFRPVEEHV